MALGDVGQPPAPSQAPAAAGASAPTSAPFLGWEYVLGSAAAPVTIVAYLSPACRHCAAFDRDVLPHLRAAYVDAGRLRLILRETLSAPSPVAAGEWLLARCGGEALYFDRLERLFRAQEGVLAAGEVAGGLFRAGASLGLDEDQTRACLSDARALDLLNDRTQAAAAAGVDGTPTFIVNGRMLARGERIGGSVYEGGELTGAQFDAVVKAALRRR